MKFKFLYSVSFLVLLFMLVETANSQTTRNKKKRPAAKKTTKQSDYFGNNTDNKKGNTQNGGDYFGGNKTDTSKKGGTAGVNIPLEFVPSTGNPLTDTIKRTLRSEDAIERNLVKERKPLEYENIREDDAVFRQRVWRVIDIREKINQPFRNPAANDGSSELFLAILYNSIIDKEAPVTAFKDERFSDFYTPEDFQKRFSGGYDTSNVLDLDGNVVKRQVRQRSFAVDSVYQYEIKEEWIFDKESSRMFVRILGIAPMMKTYLSDGSAASDQAFPLFWVYYPDMRPVLAKHEVYNPKNYGARMSWEDLFESRMFNSYIVKSTLDNPYDLPLSGFIKDPLFRLLAGEHIKEKIFDYEQSLWSY